MILKSHLFVLLLAGHLMAQTSKSVDPLSGQSLNLILVHDNTELGTATGFVVQKADSYFLITNWHVVSGRDYRNDSILSPTGLIPNKLSFGTIEQHLELGRIEPNLYTTTKASLAGRNTLAARK